MLHLLLNVDTTTLVSRVNDHHTIYVVKVIPCHPLPLPYFFVSNAVCVCYFTGIGAGLEFMSENSIGWGPTDNPRVSTEMQSAKQYHCLVISLFLVPFCSMNMSP